MEIIKLLNPYFEFVDDRGTITGLAQQGTWKEVNTIFSKKGSRRGDHYHKKITEMFIILEGNIRLHLQSEQNKERVMTLIVMPGDVFIIPPMVWHTFEVMEDSRWMNLLSEVVMDDMFKRE